MDQTKEKNRHALIALPFQSASQPTSPLQATLYVHRLLVSMLIFN